MHILRNLLCAAVLASSTPVVLADSRQHMGQSLDHSAQAIAHATVGSVKLVSGAVALPLLAVGEIGKVSGELGEAMWDEANTALPITDEVMTTSPSPAEAMQEGE